MTELTFSNGRRAQVRPAPPELVQQFITLVSRPTSTATQQYRALAEGLALVLPYVVCEIDPDRITSLWWRLGQNGVTIEADSQVLYLIASIVTPADWAQFGAALAGQAFGPEVSSA